jgi:hypothetical protein
MANERHDESQNPNTDLDNVEVTELEDKDLEDASGGTFGSGATLDEKEASGNFNCGC